MNSHSMPLIEPGLGPIREAVFDLDEPVCWAKEDFDRYWPYCDNIWSFRKRLGDNRVLYRCRLERATRPKPKQEGVKHRNRPLREKRCSAHMVMESFADGSIKIRRRGETSHAHNLAAVDKVKINSALKKIEKEELQKGYTPQAVWSALTFHQDGEGQRLLDEAGGRHLDSAHVYNQSLLLKKTPKKAGDEEDAEVGEQQQHSFDQELDTHLSQHHQSHELQHLQEQDMHSQGMHDLNMHNGNMHDPALEDHTLNDTVLSERFHIPAESQMMLGGHMSSHMSGLASLEASLEGHLAE